MKNKKFIIGLATLAVATPLAATISGCATNTTSNIVNVHKTNNDFVAGQHKVTSANKFVSISNDTIIDGQMYDASVKIINTDEWFFPEETDIISAKCGDEVLEIHSIRRTSYTYDISIDCTDKELDGDVEIFSNIQRFGAGAGSYGLEINFEINTRYSTIEKVIPESAPLNEFTFTMPSEILDHNKTYKDGGHWKYAGGVAYYPLNVDADGKVTIDFTGVTKRNETICLYIQLQNKDSQSDISHCSWHDFLFWYGLSRNNLDDFKSMFGLSTSELKDSLIGVERKLKWEGVEHVVRIVDTDEYDHETIPLYKGEAEGEYNVIEDTAHPENNEKAGLVFQFANLLTHANGDVVHSQWHKGEFFDHDDNCWCNVDGDHDGLWTKNNCKLRSFLNNKTDFLDKFYDDQELVNSIERVWNRRFTDTDDTFMEFTTANWVQDRFFIPTGHQMGDSFGHGGYLYEGEENKQSSKYENIEVSSFTYWRSHNSKSDRIMYTAGSTPKAQQYWVASPSCAGSGVFAKEDTLYIKCDGSFDHCNVDNSKAYLPCFCL